MRLALKYLIKRACVLMIWHIQSLPVDLRRPARTKCRVGLCLQVHVCLPACFSSPLLERSKLFKWIPGLLHLRLTQRNTLWTLPCSVGSDGLKPNQALLLYIYISTRVWAFTLCKALNYLDTWVSKRRITRIVCRRWQKPQGCETKHTLPALNLRVEINSEQFSAQCELFWDCMKTMSIPWQLFPLARTWVWLGEVAWSGRGCCTGLALWLLGN